MSANVRSFAQSPKQPETLTKADFEKLRLLIESTLGISMPESKRSMLETRLLRRLRQLGLSTFSEYCRVLEQDHGSGRELSLFFDLVTTNKTSFFREAPQLDFLASLLPQKFEDAARKGAPLRVWSAACSSGEEVWTLAMMLDSVRQQHSIATDYVILGSDVSGRVLRMAIAAKYEQEQLDGVPLLLRARYFMRSREAGSALVRVVPELRAKAGFFKQNLMAPQYAVDGPVDVVLLRNALIYFPRQTQLEIVARATRYLNHGGLFAVGLTETLHGSSLPLTHLSRSVYRREKARVVPSEC